MLSKTCAHAGPSAPGCRSERIGSTRTTSTDCMTMVSIRYVNEVMAKQYERTGVPYCGRLRERGATVARRDNRAQSADWPRGPIGALELLQRRVTPVLDLARWWRT